MTQNCVQRAVKENEQAQRSATKEATTRENAETERTEGARARISQRWSNHFPGPLAQILRGKMHAPDFQDLAAKLTKSLHVRIEDEQSIDTQPHIDLGEPLGGTPSRTNKPSVGPHRRAQAHQAQTPLAQSEQLRARERQVTVLDERNRVALEINDVLAHSLGALGIQLQATQAVLEAGDHGHAHTLLTQAQRMATDGLVETRWAVRALRGDTPP